MEQRIDPITMNKTVGDVIYLHQAMKQPDRKQFLKEMIKKLMTHQKHEHWKIVPIEDVPKVIKMLDSVWAMRRK